MRKFFNGLVSVALAVLATVSFTACSDDDDPQPANTLKQINWTVTGQRTAETAGIIDYDVVLTFPDGTTHSFSELSFSQTLAANGAVPAEGTDFPATFTLTVKRTIDPDFTPTEGQTVKLEDRFNLSLICEYADGTKSESKGNGAGINIGSFDLNKFIASGQSIPGDTFVVKVVKDDNGEYVIVPENPFEK